jgi:hypothetical protein
MIAIARRIGQTECPLLWVPAKPRRIGVGRNLHSTIPEGFTGATREEKLCGIRSGVFARGDQGLDLGRDETQRLVRTVQLPLEKLRAIDVHFHRFRAAASTENAH